MPLDSFLGLIQLQSRLGWPWHKHSWPLTAGCKKRLIYIADAPGPAYGLSSFSLWQKGSRGRK